MKQLTENEITIEEITLVMKALFNMCQNKGIDIRTSCLLRDGDPITEVDTSTDNTTIILW